MNDHAGERVGQHRLQAVTHLDADLALGRSDQEQHAVVLGLGADAPGATQLVAVVLDLVALQARDGGDHQLVTGLGLQLGKPTGQLLGRLRRQHMGVIDDPPGQGREFRRGQGRPGQGQEAQDREDERPPRSLEHDH
ncbi:hypothetical protein GALL_530280 [mine drainage metagenome]|uniref:Uncharacterized protein n=1 Tax=mine drainage metagenome TaxID=410659 RepID=A0A1J5PD31_9ZZZZ